MLNIIVHPEADMEIIEASAYIEQPRERFGFLFLEELQTAIEYLSEYPVSHQLKYRQMRELYIRRFSYVVVYEIHGKDLHIYHVMHTSRDTKRRYRKRGKR